MKESYIKKLYSSRIAAAKEKSAENEGKCISVPYEILDFSDESPEATPDFLVIDTLYKEASKWENRGYGGRNENNFNEKASQFIADFYGVPKPEPSEEVCATQGTTAALNLMALAFINRGDFSIIPKPCVSPLETMTKWLGGNVIDVPLSHKNKFMPKYEEIPQKNLKKAKLLYINYPGNPTGQSATHDFFKETVDFAKLNNLIVIHDASFAPLAYEEGKALSFLSAQGAKKVGAELHSFSHGFNMAGWRIGFMAGNKNVIKAFKEISSKSGFRTNAPIRQAAAYALSRPDIPIGNAKKYERRISILINVLSKLGFKLKKPKAGFYVYTKAPKGTVGGEKFASSYEFDRFLAARGIKAKAFDDGCIRFSATFSALGESEEKKAAESLYERLKEFEFIF